MISRVQQNRQLVQNYWRPYQNAWFCDDSRLKICLKSRQIGMSEALIWDAIMECQQYRYHNVYLASLSFREAKELIRRARIWIEKILPSITGKPPIAECTKTQISFHNGSRIMALPAKKIRSRSGTIILDEFAFYQNPNEVWAAVAPAIESNPNMNISIVSTPYGADGKFYEIWNNEEGNYDQWSRHKIDVYKAAKQGFPVDPDDLKERYPYIFDQEFGCQFVTDEDQFFTNDLLMKATYDDHWMEHIPAPDEDEKEPEMEWFGGLDLATSKDKSVFSTLLALEHESLVLEPDIIKDANERMDYDDQEKKIHTILDNRAYSRVAVDAAGEGSATGQNLRKKYGSSLISEIKGSKWKGVLEKIPKLRHDLETGDVKIPRDQNLLRAFRSIEKSVKSNRSVKWKAEQNKHGHADEFYATLLAYHNTTDMPSWSFS